MSVLGFLFKSKEERERESRDMEASSYPFGKKQRQTVLVLLKELLPEEPEALAQTIFLIGKRAYRQDKERAVYDPALPLNERLPGTFRVLGKQLFGRHREKMPRYLALILADDEVDETLRYPSKTELLCMAQELAPLCPKSKKRRRT